jgi:hypothetical protein
MAKGSAKVLIDVLSDSFDDLIHLKGQRHLEASQQRLAVQ